MRSSTTGVAMLKKCNRSVLSLVAGAALLTLAAAACAPGQSPTATPTAMMQKTPDAMMNKTPDAMMKDKTPDTMMQKTPDAMMEKLPEQQFAAHFVSSDPTHGAKLVQTPANITLNFNFTLNETSTVGIVKDGKAITLPKPIFTGNKLGMSIALPAGSGNGLYVVDYKACWPDNSCHNGKFGFTVG